MVIVMTKHTFTRRKERHFHRKKKHVSIDRFRITTLQCTRSTTTGQCKHFMALRSFDAISDRVSERFKCVRESFSNMKSLRNNIVPDDDRIERRV